MHRFIIVNIKYIATVTMILLSRCCTYLRACMHMHTYVSNICCVLITIQMFIDNCFLCSLIKYSKYTTFQAYVFHKR